MSYNCESSSLHQQQIQRGEEFWRPVVVGKKLREVAKEVKGVIEENKTPTAVWVLPTVDKSKCMCIELKDEQMAGGLVSQPFGFKIANIEDDEKRETRGNPSNG